MTHPTRSAAEAPITKAGDKAMVDIVRASMGWRESINIPRLIRDIEVEAALDRERAAALPTLEVERLRAALAGHVKEGHVDLLCALAIANAYGEIPAASTETGK